MSGLTTRPRHALEHEPPEPGWWPRPLDCMLRPSRLEVRRRRTLARWASERPRLHAWVVRRAARSRAFWDRALPQRHVLPVTVVVVVLTLFDAFATLVLVGVGVAEEGNPLLAALIDRIGLVPAMGVRTLVGLVLTLTLAWLATWRREVRPVLAFAAVVLTLVAGLHIGGTVRTFV